MLGEEEDPPSPDASPPLNSVSGRQGSPRDSNNNSGGQYGHLRTLYQLQNMLTRQLNFPQQHQQNTHQGNVNNTGHATDVVIDIPQQNPNDNSHNNNHNNAANNHSANAGDTITTHEIDGTRLDLQLITTWLEQAFPFVFLLLLVWIYEHRNGMSLKHHLRHFYS
jgi:hypothetical protein